MNERIKLRARGAGVPLWKIARELGISEPTITRWLRVPLSAEREAKIRSAIEKLSKEVDEHGE